MKLKQTYSMVLAAAAAAMFFTSTPLHASEADDRIDSSFKNSFVYKTHLKDDAIKVKTVDGVVTLTGTVSDESGKALAQETAANIPGVARVDNQLVTKAQSATDNADTWIGRKVKLALLFHRNVSASKTTVEVSNGVVTLKGEAQSAAEKELATEYATDIDGVKEVKNEMTIAAAPATAVRSPGEKLDDASVTALVKVALATRRSTSALKTKVETRDGEVTLTGIAKNDAEKALVSKVVTNIQGVTDVKNQMTVEEVKTK